MSDNLFNALQRTLTLQRQLDEMKRHIVVAAKAANIELPKNADYGWLLDRVWSVGRQELKYKKALESQETYSHAMIVHRVVRHNKIALIIGCTDDDYETPLVMIAYNDQEVNWNQL